MSTSIASITRPCRTCGTRGWERIQRTGFVQKRLLPFFHLYPWRCPICNKHRYLPLRSDPRLHHAQR